MTTKEYEDGLKGIAELKQLTNIYDSISSKTIKKLIKEPGSDEVPSEIQIDELGIDIVKFTLEKTYKTGDYPSDECFDYAKGKIQEFLKRHFA
ncbi:MAG: hypothetical protein GY853_16315 [PVC group bacterium]|nr:hypothetical protein [PVC group bacterium]